MDQDKLVHEVFLSAERPVKARLPCQPDLPFRKPTSQPGTVTFEAVATQLGATPM